MVIRWQGNILSLLTRAVIVLPRTAVTRTRLRLYATAVTTGQDTVPAALPHLLRHDTPAPIVVPSIQLRQYQLDCIDAVLNAFQDGKRQVGVSLATGSGKTVSTRVSRCHEQIINSSGHLHGADRPCRATNPPSHPRSYLSPSTRTC